MIIETITIEGLDSEIPKEQREQINDAIHDILRENADMNADVVYWQPSDETTDE